MKNLNSFLLIILCSTLCLAQNESNFWHFGANACINFNSGSPVAETGSMINTPEGCASISNNTGALLFYTDGITVYNKNHQVMVNGTDLTGSYSSSQSAVIVPKPGSSTIYYILTTGELANENGLRYSVVDMEMDSGLGEVTDKNILLLSPTCEKISIIKKPGGNELWALTHGYPNNNFYAFLISNSGIFPSPVISSVGTIVGDMNKTIGYLKFSPDGTKILCATYSDVMELYDFDGLTGIVSNAMTISSHHSNYGVEFSPSGKMAYLTTGNDAMLSLLQYDLSSDNIPASETLIYSAPAVANQLGALQLGIDGKIYASVFDSNFLARINNPDAIGPACNFQLNAVDLGSGICKSGLPQFIQSYFDVGLTISALCLGDTTQFGLVNSNGVLSVSWNFGDGTLATGLNPTHNYLLPGNYEVVATVTSLSGAVEKHKQVTISQRPVANPIVDQTVCTTTPAVYQLSANDSALLQEQSSNTYGISYYLTQVDADNNQNMLNDNYNVSIGEKIFYARVYNKQNVSCYSTISFKVNFVEAPTVVSVGDYYICAPQPADGLATFDLGLKNNEILSGQSPAMFGISYHLSFSDAEANLNPLPTLYTSTLPSQVIYARIQNNTNASCNNVISFSLVELEQPVIAAVNDYILCDDVSNDGFESFDLESRSIEILGSYPASDYNVTYYESLADAQSGSNAISGPYINQSDDQIIYVVLSHIVSKECRTISNFMISVTMHPDIVTPVALRICDDEANDGKAVFDLSSQNSMILGNLSSGDFNITYHLSEEDAQSGLNMLPLQYANTNNPELVYARVENLNNPDCFATTSFNVIADTQAVFNGFFDLSQCEESEGTGKAMFDFNLQDNKILAGQSNIDFGISYHYTLQDALTGINPLLKEYINQASQETIFVRVENNLNPFCFVTGSFKLEVFSKPLLGADETVVLCKGKSLTLMAPLGYDDYKWSNGERGNSIIVNDTGIYSLTASNIYGNIICNSEKKFEVIPSEVATIEDVIIRDWTYRNNTIEVLVNGVGNYLYSIDGINYQRDNSFSYLSPGLYTIYVKDDNGCGITKQEVSVLSYPKFFTPNSDGENDVWSIDFSYFEKDIKVEIFDRYGKVLAILTPGKSWDGKFNSVDVPATDYWFVVKRQKGDGIEGHFSLIR